MGENTTNSIMATEPTGNNLKEALCVQQRLLQQLYTELDVERESAATAASEALSMILRLQGEKAAVKMEAEQYKRLAEEKMNHAEESFQVFEEIMYHKEIEIASLDYQVQAYRYKLLSLGVDDLGVNEIKFPENLLQRTDTLVGETSSEGLAKRKTPPPKRLKLSNLKKGTLERDRSIVEDPDTIAKIVEESSRDDENNQIQNQNQNQNQNQSQNQIQIFDSGLRTEASDINSYLEQIRKLDRLVEDVAGEQYICSTKPSRCSSVRSKLNEMDLVQSQPKSISSDACSSSVHDVFEVPVPQTIEYHQTLDCRDEGGKSIFKDDERFRKLVAVKSYERDEIYSGKRPPIVKHKSKKVFLPIDGVNMDCHMALFRSATSTSEGMNMMTSEIYEGETEGGQTEQNARQELKLLYEIREKLNSIQSDIRSKNTKVNNRSSPNYDLPMLQLREAMMHFWF